MKIYLILLNLFLTLICRAGLLEDYRIQPINNQEALPGKEINCIFQDSENYIWFGTSDGLCRYDGYTIKTYKSSHQEPYLLEDNMVTCLAEDGKGLLWIGSIMGVNIYDRKTGKIEKVKDSRLSNKYTRIIYYSEQHRQVWIGTESGLYVYDELLDIYHEFLPDPENPATISGDRIRSLFKDSDGNMWIGIFGKGLCKMNMETFLVIRYPEISSNNRVSVIFEDRDHNLWLGAWADGVYKVLNRESPTTTTYLRMDTNTRYERLIHVIIQEEDGHILLGTGLGMDLIAPPYSSGQYHSSDNEKLIDIPNYEINHLYRDKDGIIWIATKGSGVYQLFKEKKIFTNHLYETLDDLNQPASMNAFYEWGDNILIGTDKVGIVRFNKTTQKISSSQHDSELIKIPFPMGNIRAIVKHPEIDILYLGSEYGGLYECKLAEGHIRSAHQYYNPWTSNWLTGDIVQAICCDNEKNIWIGSNGGFNIFTPTGDTLTYNYRELGKNINCQSIFEDNRGRIWIGTSHNGIIRADKGNGIKSLSFHEYTLENNKLNSNDVKCLYQDSKGWIFAGTKGGGLCFYNEGKDSFERMNGMDGFAGDAILSIIESEHYLYMGTNHGLLQFDPHGEESKQLIIFTESDGLMDNTFNANAVMKSKNGTLYFGTPRGFISFDPKQIEAEIPSGKLIISDIKIFHNSFDYLPVKKQKQISPDYHPNYTKRITLSHNDYNFGIEFATLSYKHPEKNRYAYMLKGFDKDWNYVTAANRSAYYTNMKSGTYHFMVKGTNENSFMNQTPEILEIVVLPPFYKSWWAYLIYFALFTLLSYVIIRIILYRSRMEMLDIEHRKNEELTQEKLKFFTNISHELLTPLTIISCSVEELQRKYNGHGNNWKAIKGNIFRLNRLLEQIVGFRKAEQEKLKLSVSYGDAGIFITNLCGDNFRYYEQNKRIRFTYESSPEHIPAWFDKNIVDMIMYNLISNAFKYNQANGQVSVHIKAEEQIAEYEYRFLNIKVGNTGAGLSPKQLNELFQRFQSYSYIGREKQGNGIGLYLTKTLVELHKGSIRVNSTPNEWTEFIVRIPINKNSYNSEIEKQVLDTEKTIQEVETDFNIHRSEKTPYTILIIEDDTELLESVSNLLSDSFTIISATDGKSGLQMADEQNPDLIISDVMLPEINGFDLCRILKEDLSVSHIPVILLTAKISPVDKVYGFGVGADAYITKPFRFDILFAQIQSLLSNRKKIIDKFRKNEQLTIQTGIKTSPDQQFLEQAITLIEKNMDYTDFSINIFSKEMHVSNSMLYRKLKALTGLSPNEFIRNIRLKKACILLSENRYNISEIAYQVGFNDAKYFSSCFKKEFGKTPSEYIDEYTGSL